MQTSSLQPELLYVDNHLVVFNKPARMLTQPDQTGDVALSQYASDVVAKKFNKPGRAFIGIVHRLDRQVSGVVVLARTSKAASRLSDQIRRRAVDKTYIARVEGTLTGSGEWRDELLFDRTKKECILRFRSLASNEISSLVSIDLVTGRKHQIRRQCAQRGHAIVGDRRYGSSIPYSPGIALHCKAMRVQHPTTREEMTFIAQTPFD